jgi:hypothetical protein
VARPQGINDLKIKKQKTRKIVFFLILALLLLLCILLAFQFKEDIQFNFLKKPKLYVIKDECSLIFNNIIHEFKSSGECEIFCKNGCSIRKEKFYRSDFIEKNNSCHTCNCYCI